MTEANNEADQTEEQTSLFFGARLKAAREAAGLSIKDVSFQLRLKEHIIERIESDQLPGDLPMAFARGYMRTYGKFLNISESDVNNAIRTILPDPEPKITHSEQIHNSSRLINKQRAMQLATSLVSITLVGLVVSWWFGHNPNDEQNYLFASNKTQPQFQTQVQMNQQEQTIAAKTVQAEPAEAPAVAPNSKIVSQSTANPATPNTSKTTSTDSKTIDVAKSSVQQPLNTNTESTKKPLLLANKQTKPTQESNHHEDDYYDDEYDDEDME